MEPGPGGSEPDPKVRPARKRAEDVTPTPWDHEGRDEEVEHPGESPGDGGEEPEGGSEGESAAGAGEQLSLDAESLARLKRAARSNPDLARSLGLAILGIEDDGSDGGGAAEEDPNAPKILSKEELKTQFRAILDNREDPDREWKAMELLQGQAELRSETRLRQAQAESEQTRRAESRRTLRQIELQKKHPDWRVNKDDGIKVYRSLSKELSEAGYDGQIAFELPPVLIMDHVKAERARANGSRAARQAASTQAVDQKKTAATRAQTQPTTGRPAGPVERKKPSAEEELVARAARHYRNSTPRLPF